MALRDGGQDDLLLSEELREDDEFGDDEELREAERAAWATLVEPEPLGEADYR